MRHHAETSATTIADLMLNLLAGPRKPKQLSADSGYCSEANLWALENRNIDAYVATGRARDAAERCRDWL
jgi:hypothetical protein